MNTGPSQFALLGAAALALLAGCSGGSQLPAGNAAMSPASNAIPSVRPVSMRVSNHTAPAAPFMNVAAVNAPGGNQTFVSNSGSNTVDVWGANDRLNGIITTRLNAPLGLATDAAQRLYVVNAGDANVLVFPKPYTSFTNVLSDFHESPNAVAVSSAGVVAVTNDTNTATGGFGSVNFYAKGASTPCATIGNPNWSQMAWDAFDASGNLLVTGINAHHTAVLVGEISGGCAAKSIVSLRTGNALQSAGAIQIHAGKILIMDPSGVTIYTYVRNGTSLGSPVARTTMARTVAPASFAIERGVGLLWVADSAGGAAYEGAAFEYTYPGGVLRKAIADDLFAPYGIAVIPAALP
jgi:hypothetical protein